MELNLNIDENGRTAAPPRPSPPEADPQKQQQQQEHFETLLLDYKTKSFQLHNLSDGNNKLYQALIRDCKATTASELPLTFWLSMKDKPRCTLEALAKEIFDFHVKAAAGTNDKNASQNYSSNLDCDKCGCEWWIQLRPSPPNSNRTNSNQEEAKRGIEFHWDKDEALRDMSGGSVFLHPHLSTVTYLTDHGAPTMIFEDSMPEEELLMRDIKGVFVSWPKIGKHLTFDGRFLHGAPSNLFNKNNGIRIGGGSGENGHVDETKNPRVTFLVNIWLHHKPLGVEPFPEEMLEVFRNGTRSESDILSKSRACTSYHAVLQNASNNKEELADFTWGLGEQVSIHAKLPLQSVLNERDNMNHDGNVSISWLGNDMAKVRAVEPDS